MKPDFKKHMEGSVRVFRMEPVARIIFSLTGIVMMVASIMAMRESYVDNVGGAGSLVVIGLFYSFCFVFGLFAFLIPLNYKIVLEGEKLTRYRLDRPASILRSEISHYKLEQKGRRRDRWLIIYPLATGRRPIKINTYVGQMNELLRWLDKRPGRPSGKSQSFKP